MIRKFLIGCILALGLIATPAMADDYYVAPTGSAIYSGATSSGSHPGTLADANDQASPGDNVILAAGVYTDPIAPVNAGNDYSSPVSYSGGPGVYVPGAAIVAQFINVSNVNFTKPVFLDVNGSNDVFINTVFNGLSVHGSDNKFLNFSGTGRFECQGDVHNYGVAGDSVLYYAARDTFGVFTWNYNSLETNDVQVNLFLTKTTNDIYMYSGDITLAANMPSFNNVNGWQFFEVYRSKRLKVTDVNINVTNNAPVGANIKFAFSLRDSMITPRFTRLKIKVDGSHDTEINFHNSGSYTYGLAQNFDHCIFIDKAGALTFRGAGQASSFNDCVLLALGQDGGIWDGAAPMIDSVYFYHCSIIGIGTQTISFQRDATSKLRIKSCFIYHDGTYGEPTPCTNDVWGSAFKFYQSDGAIAAVQDSNAYFNRTSIGAFKHGGYPCRALLTSFNGFNSWQSESGQDSHSVWKDLGMIDSTTTINENTWIPIRSPSNATSYYGAHPSAAVADVQTLSTTLGTFASTGGTTGNMPVTMQITSPGGISAYEVRWSHSLITTANWSSASLVGGTLPTPGAAGSIQTFSSSVYSTSVATSGTTNFYWAVKGKDAWGVYSTNPKVVYNTYDAGSSGGGGGGIHDVPLP